MSRFLKLTRRAILLRCPRCAGQGVFEGWFTMADDCPTCGHHFERESGYWVGAMIINFAMTAAAFLVVFAAGAAITWPDPPYTVLTIVSLIIGGLTPVVGFPWSRTLFVALEMNFHPLEPHEIQAADARIGRRQPE